MHVIVGGCGRLGSQLAERLSDDPDTDVVVIDIDELAFDRLGAAFNGETVVGDVTDRDVLEQAGVERADVLITATRADNANLMAVEIGTELYGVPRAVARLFNPERENVYRRLGIRYVSGTGVLAKLFLDQINEDALPHHLLFEHDGVRVVDLEIGPAGHGMTVDDLESDGDLRVAAIERGTRVIIPSGDDRLQRGDVVAAAARRGTGARLREVLRLPEGRRSRRR